MFQTVEKAEVSLDAVVIRADGTEENLGTISKTTVTDESRLKRIMNSLRSSIAEIHK